MWSQLCSRARSLPNQGRPFLPASCTCPSGIPLLLEDLHLLLDSLSVRILLRPVSYSLGLCHSTSFDVSFRPDLMDCATLQSLIPTRNSVHHVCMLVTCLLTFCFSVLPGMICRCAVTSSRVQSRCKTLSQDVNTWFTVIPGSEALQKALEDVGIWQVMLYPARG